MYVKRPVLHTILIARPRGRNRNVTFNDIREHERMEALVRGVDEKDEESAEQCEFGDDHEG